MLKLCIIVPANTTNFNETILQTVLKVTPTDCQVDIHNITQGNPDIENRVNWSQNNLPTIELIQNLKDEYDGFFVSDFDMCGVEAAREITRKPIIGGLRGAVFTALTVANNFSIITILKSTVAMQLEHVKRFGLMDNFASIHPIDIPVPDLKNKKKTATAVALLAKNAVEEHGAESIVLGCTGFIDIAADAQEILLQQYNISAPIIDPNQTGISQLITLVRTKQTQSQVTYGGN